MERLPPPKELCRTELTNSPEDWRFVFDFDGTLANFHVDASQVVFPKSSKVALEKINKKLKYPVLILSGRDYYQLTDYFSGTDFCLVGNHGARSNFFELNVSRKHLQNQQLNDYLHRLVGQFPGSKVEEKSFSRVFHFRKCGEAITESLQQKWRKEINDLLRETDLTCTSLNMALEIKDQKCTKLTVMEELKKNSISFSKVICFGDDKSEQDIFQKLTSPSFISVAVGSRIDGARYKIDSPEELGKWLEELSAQAPFG